MRSQISAVAALLIATLTLGGCSTVTNPGAPDQSFDIDQDIQELEAIFEQGPTIKDFYASPTEKGRNEFISGRLTLMNIQYIKFIRKFAVEKAQLDTAADILIVGVNLAGTLVGAATTKGILAAISGGTAASRTSINKNFFHEKTVPVLVTAMNAERKEALIPIFQGIGKSLDEYPFARALSDLHVYYQAGTFIGALQAIQKDSGAKEERADAILFPKYSKESLSEQAFLDREDLKTLIDGLEGAKAKTLITNIQTVFPSQSTIDFIAAQYPDDVVDADGSKAKTVLKRLISRTAKEREDRRLWQAAINSL